MKKLLLVSILFMVCSVGFSQTFNQRVAAASPVQSRTSTGITGNDTLTSTELYKGLITITSGKDTVTLPTASAMATKLGAAAGTTFDFTVLNIASGDTALIRVNTGIVVQSAVTGGTNLHVVKGSTTGGAGFKLMFLSTSKAILSRQW